MNGLKCKLWRVRIRFIFLFIHKYFLKVESILSSKILKILFWIGILIQLPIIFEFAKNLNWYGIVMEYVIIAYFFNHIWNKVIL